MEYLDEEDDQDLAGASSGAEKKALVQKISLSNQSLLDQLERLTQATR